MAIVIKAVESPDGTFMIQVESETVPGAAKTLRTVSREMVGREIDYQISMEIARRGPVNPKLG